jgi:arylformamidase
MRIIDISQSFYEGMPSYPADWYPRFAMSRVMTPDTDPSPTTRHFSHLHLFPHNATHIESGFHFFPDGEQIDQVAIDRFVGRACVADLSHKGELEAIDGADLDAAVGAVWTPGDRLLVRTDYLERCWGRDDYWDQPPYLTPSAADWAIEHGAALVGLDCLTERPGDQSSVVHRMLLGAGIPILEYVTNLRAVREPVVQLVALPIRVANVEAAPARAVVLENGASGLAF